ncbi:inorganic phosphate transporter [Nocardia seriolae]|uniref:Phosphate transporter n=1 Tax=Nocardia seriolae TaxID=37332 RepID=A0A0B8NA32_9NOCA|nr:inorganic phosphate transporter [Nocardia seriolae]APA94174.1 putative low-affinity inorganic phosphate transporter [Nocardia seriolae]MTJ60608.1 inorganic phosphate transporter [Nocardia seriolae]MTJ74043.1 inorganic phosphate transporter [Nocardia seriolae]MTJ84521.1 inorganic phosphate transporter [Nocardia seriolae]MTK28508.1 inorganic phosphate transporter [Nocardia seriolae]
MSAELLVLLIVVCTALAFDFTNGFHDTANAMATSIATGALRPRTAVLLSGALNLIGAFLSVAVAATVAAGIVDLSEVSGRALLDIVFAGLVGGILWNLFTWLLGLPSSSSHALFGGLIGSTIAALGWHGVIWSAGNKGVLAKIIIPALLSPIVAALVASIASWVVYRITKGSNEKTVSRGFRFGQIGTASLVSLAHGTNDAQKTMGIIFLALIAHGSAKASDPLPLWVIVSCAVAMAAGTCLGGWRIIRTLGKGLVDIAPPQGFAAESTSAAIILTSAHFGLPLSTTQVVTGSILGSGIGRPGAEVRWGVLGRMVTAWALTLPLAGAVGALCWAILHVIGGTAGVLVVFALLIVMAALIWFRSKRAEVNSHNVTDEWEPAPAATPQNRDDDPAARGNDDTAARRNDDTVGIG